MSWQSDTIRPEGFIQASNFFVMFGPIAVSFSKISNLEETMGYEAIAEGGFNDGVHVLAKSNSQIGTAVFEKAVHEKDPLEFDTFVDVGSKYSIVNIFVTRGSRPLKLYMLMDCLVVKRTLSELDAANSSLLIARLDVVYSHMSMVPIPI